MLKLVEQTAHGSRCASPIGSLPGVTELGGANPASEGLGTVVRRGVGERREAVVRAIRPCLDLLIHGRSANAYSGG